ncbi:MAG TPA: hypothetical protein PLP33_27165 [Leptospiraceae bacterium]|nr:hypothetical protein [Leptospiraceae bacterium]
MRQMFARWKVNMSGQENLNCNDSLMTVVNLRLNLSAEQKERIRENVDPSLFIPFDSESGERFWLAMEWMFGVRGNQKLLGVSVGLEGISAFLDNK